MTDFDISSFEKGAAEAAGVDVSDVRAEVESADVALSLGFDEAASSDDVQKVVALTSNVTESAVAVSSPDSSGRRLGNIVTWAIKITTSGLQQAAAVQLLVVDTAALNASLHAVSPNISWTLPTLVSAPIVDVHVVLYSNEETAARFVADGGAALEAVVSNILGVPVNIVKVGEVQNIAGPPMGSPEDTSAASSGIVGAVIACVIFVGIVSVGVWSLFCRGKARRGNEDPADSGGGPAVITPADMDEAVEPPADSDEEGPVSVADVVVGHHENVKQFLV